MKSKCTHLLRCPLPFFFLWIFSFSLAASQKSSFYFKSLGVEDGLSQNMVYAILQDRQGFMWFATQDGLNRYDGNSFKVYKKSMPGNDCLKSDAIFSLAEDAKGTLWIGTDNGVYLYDPLLERFSAFPLQTNAGKTVTGIVRDILPDKAGNIWLTVSDQGVFCVTPARETRFYSLTRELGKGKGSIRDLCFDGKGNLWIATYQKGVFQLVPSTGVFSRFAIDSTVQNLSDNDVNALCVLNPETLLVGTVGKGVLQFDLRSHRFAPFVEKGEDGKTLFVRNLCIDKENKVWMGTETGAYIYSPASGEKTHLRHVFNDPYSLSDNAIHSIYQDREGGMWLGTYFGGVNYFTQAYAQFEKYYPIVGENLISGKSISEFCEDGSGNIWIGTEDAGLNCFDPVNRTFKQGFVGVDNIHALLCEEDKLWIGSFSNGLFVRDLRTGNVKNYRSSSSEETLHNDNIYSIYKDYQGIVWIGTMTGLHRYLPRTDSFEAVRAKEISSQVNDILEDFDGVLWFATLGQGVFSYDRKQDRWEHHALLVKEDVARGKMASCLLEDKKHRLWVGTEGAGLVCYDRQTRSFVKRYDVNNGLPNNVIYQLLEDSSGCVWGSTNKGLFRLDPALGKVKEYTHSDGLLGDQFNYKSGFVSKSGRMYFGGVKGFIAFRPDELAASQVPPTLVFNSFQLYNVEVPVGGSDSPLQHSITHTEQITLSNSQSIFSLGFTALSYSSPQGNRYAYKLEGWDRDWIYVGQSHRVTYSNLPPGKYTFCVKAVNNDGLWNEVGKSIDIRILPPFYRTVWAYLCYLILVAGLGYYIIKVYTRRLQKRNREAWEQLERRKETELYNAKINFFTNVTHEIRTPLSLIKAPLEEVMKQIKPSDACFDNLSIIQRNANRLLKLVNELLDFRKAEVGGLRLNFVRTDVAELVTETVRRFMPTAGTKHIAFEETYPEGRMMADVDVEVFTKILSNLFNNALKHADTFIRISLSGEDERFRLVVSNDGDRIPVEHSERIFDPFVKLDGNSLGTGIGLPFARTLIETHKGQIYVDTRCPDTTFVIVLPIRQELTIVFEEAPCTEHIPDGKEPAEGVILPGTERRKTILSVEDNEEFQNFMTNQLKSDYLILKAQNGKQALEILTQQTVDLIISDVMMPVMDGMTLCREVKENIRYSHIPIILLTAKTGLQSQIDGLKTGADEYIAKPYSVDYLKARTENLLLNRQKIREAYKHSPESTVDVIAHSKADEDFLNKLVDAIHTRLEEVDLDVDALAVMMNMSRATLYRKVKSISELTPNDFIRLIRLKKAAELLRDKEYRVNEIAFIVGFSSSSYFSKCFYKQFGVLPKDFERKK